MSEEHRKAFVAESEEGITELNNALLDLEADPEDAEAMDSIFRTAHTLKGNGAAMGYDSVSNLAHEMEDLLDEIRAGEIEIDPDLMDLLFDGVDYLGAMVDDIAETGDTDLDATEVENDLRKLIETGEVPGAGDSADSSSSTSESTDNGDDSDAADADETSEDDAEADGSVPEVSLPDELGDYELDTGHAVFRATVGLGESAMQGVDAIFVLQ